MDVSDYDDGYDCYDDYEEANIKCESVFSVGTWPLNACRDS